jgi:glucosamine--fructose-6-phosphate aminotransferase (isomerizing)
MSRTIKPSARNKIRSAIAEVRARGGFVITIGGESADIPALGRRGTGGLAWGAMTAPWGPLEAVVPLQMLARELALQLGCDVDKPRNLAKSVTVE